MMLPLMRSELLKIKRKAFWFLAFLGPFGVVALQVVNYELRKDYLMKHYPGWDNYLDGMTMFTALALVLGIAVLTSFTASIENETNAWKQLLALPVSKWQVYLTKFTLLAGLFVFSTVLLVLFAWVYGIILDPGPVIPYGKLISQSFYPLIGALPVLALQLWIATVSKNQTIPIMTGVFGVILTFVAPLLPDWVIWKWPSLYNNWDQPLVNVLLGAGLGLLLYLVGMIDFSRRDVK